MHAIHSIGERSPTSAPQAWLADFEDHAAGSIEGGGGSNLEDVFQAHEFLCFQPHLLAPAAALGTVIAGFRAAPRLDAQKRASLHLQQFSSSC
jgi:hypothetical protein